MDLNRRNEEAFSKMRLKAAGNDIVNNQKVYYVNQL